MTQTPAEGNKEWSTFLFAFLFGELPCQNSHQNKFHMLTGFYNRGCFHCICCRKVPTSDRQSSSAGSGAQTAAGAMELDGTFSGFIDFLSSKLQGSLPLAPRKLLSKCPPAHMCVLFMVSCEILHHFLCVGGFSVPCVGHQM